MKLFYSPDYVAAAEIFDTTRKAKWIVNSLIGNPISGVTIVEPRPLTFAEIALVHDPAYVEAVRTGQPADLATSQGFEWDPGMWRAVLASNGGLVSALDAALQDGVAGTLSSGLHHARRETGMGFCTFNGLAIAAKAALSRGVEPILVIDLDAHCGGGTHSLISGETAIRQLDVSVSSVDYYKPHERNTLDLVHDADRYLETVESRLADVHALRNLPRICLYNAGMDPHQDCQTGGLAGITRSILEARERMVFDWCRRNGIAVAFCLAGGYVGGALSRDELVRLHRLTIAEACRPISGVSDLVL